MLKEETARIVTEALPNPESISEICEKYNLTSSALYKWRDEFISAGTAVMEQVNEREKIIGKLPLSIPTPHAKISNSQIIYRIQNKEVRRITRKVNRPNKASFIDAETVEHQGSDPWK